MKRRRMPPLLLLVTLVLTACSTSPTPPTTVARLEITPGSVFFTAAGESRTLSAQAFDGDGRPLDASFQWSSSHPEIVAVDAAGQITAKAALGSAQIVVEAEGVRSTAVLVLVAQPAAGAVLYGADQLAVGSELHPLELTSAPFEVGDRFGITMTNIGPPAVGAVLIPQDGSPYLGRVVSAVPVGANVEVVLEVIPLVEAFETLLIDETIELDGSFSESFAIGGPGTSARPRIEESEDGSRVTYTFRPSQAGDPTFLEIPPLFKCEASTNMPFPLAPSVLSVNVVAPLSFDVIFKKSPGVLDFEHVRMKVAGSVTGTVTGGLKLAPNMSGSVGCKAVKEVPVPLGPLSGILLPLVPVGVQVAVNGEIAVNTFEVSVVGQLKTLTPLALGFDCLQGQDCTNLSTLPDFDLSVSPRVVLPGDQNFRVTAAATIGGISGLSAGNAFLEALGVDAEVSLLSLNVGFRQDLSLGTIRDQAANADFAANYKLAYQPTIGLGSDVQKAIKLIFGTPKGITFSFTPFQIPISNSPAGSVIALEESFSAGDTVHFTVDLNPANLTYLGLYNVDEVKIYRKGSDGTLGLQPVASQDAADGQSSFDLQWTATDEGTTAGNFVAFLITDLLPFAPLKLGVTQGNICPAAGEGCGGASLTFTETFRSIQHLDEPNHEKTVEQVVTHRATLQLRKLSERGDTATFEVIGGTVSVDETFDYREVTLGGGGGDCTYNETIEDHYSGSGSAPALGEVEFETGSDDRYDIYFEPPNLEIPVAYTQVWTARYVFLGSDSSCRVDVTDLDEGVEDRSFDISVDGIRDTTTPNVVSGSHSEVNDDGAGNRTETTASWTLRFE